METATKTETLAPEGPSPDVSSDILPVEENSVNSSEAKETPTVVGEPVIDREEPPLNKEESLVPEDKKEAKESKEIEVEKTEKESRSEKEDKEAMTATDSPSKAAAESEMVSITDVEAVDFCKIAYGAIQYELAKVIVGQTRVVEEIAISLFAQGHTLLLGVPGLAKSLLVSTFAQVLGLDFKRIQFTSDMTVSDLVGSEGAKENSDRADKQAKFSPGPLFANVVLADEINRTSPRNQSAFFEVLDEKKAVVGGETHRLPELSFVVATQNLLELEGTTPLSEAYLDRFMFMIHMDYPSEEEELLLMKLGTGMPPEGPKPVLSSEHLQAIQQTIRLLPVPDHVYKYAERVVRSTRPKTKDAFDFCEKWLSFGAGPRASLALVMAAKAHALIRGQAHVHCGNIAAVAPSVLRHRLATNFLAHSEGINADAVIKKILDQIPRTDPSN